MKQLLFLLVLLSLTFNILASNERSSFSTMSLEKKVSKTKSVTVKYHYLAMLSDEVEEATVVVSRNPYEPVYAFENHHNLAYKKSVVNRYAKERADFYCQNRGFKESKEIQMKDLAKMDSEGIHKLDLEKDSFYGIKQRGTKKPLIYYNFVTNELDLVMLQPFYLDQNNDYHVYNWIFKKINCI